MNPNELADRLDRMRDPNSHPVECVTGPENFALLAAALRLAEAVRPAARCREDASFYCTICGKHSESLDLKHLPTCHWSAYRAAHSGAASAPRSPDLTSGTSGG
jgi:hypothetical protein